MLYALIFISTIFMTSSLNAMEIIKKSIGKKEHIQSFDTCPQEFLFTQKMLTHNKLTQDIITQVRRYSLLLRHQDFKNNFTFTDQWNDHLIPMRYQYCLSPQQINILEILFKTKSYTLNSWDGYGVSGYMYLLPSEKDYKKFLTLPIELRKCLVKLPQSKIKNKITDHFINTNKAIGVITPRIRVSYLVPRTVPRIEQKLIVPEEKEDKIHKPL